MFKINELAGSLIKSGRFKDAVPIVINELAIAMRHGVITQEELLNPIGGLLARFMHICLDPSDYDSVQKLGNAFIMLALRIPGMVETCSQEEYELNVKESREAPESKD
jgi:hypothetical protein